MEIVENLRVINPLDGHSLDLYWDDAEDFISEYRVYRTDVLDDNPSWELVGTSDYTFLRDTGFNEKDSHWYSVTYKNREGKESKKCEPVFYAIDDLYMHNQYVWHIGTVSKTQILFNYTAEKVRIYLARRAGERCQCYEYNQDSPEPTCTLCDGSGFEQGGFFRFQVDGEDPKVRIYNAGETIEFYPFGQIVVNEPTALGISLPVLRVGDYIYRENNPEGIPRMYRIENTHIKAFQKFITFQRYTLDEKGEDVFTMRGGDLTKVEE